MTISYLIVTGTNINEAILDGIKLIDSATTDFCFIVFLTDGIGLKDANTIMRNVRNANKYDHLLFSISFGKNADFSFLKKMSVQNGGLARKIYIDSDASLQLQHFFNEIATPVLLNIQIKYLDDNVNNSSVTSTSYRTLFNGSEIVVMGQMNPGYQTVDAEVVAGGADGDLTYTVTHLTNKDMEQPQGKQLSTKSAFGKNIERMWVYLTIKELLKNSLKVVDKNEKKKLNSQALKLSLKVIEAFNSTTFRECPI